MPIFIMINICFPFSLIRNERKNGEREIVQGNGWEGEQKSMRPSSSLSIKK